MRPTVLAELRQKPARRTVCHGDDGLGTDLAGDEDVRRGLARHAPDRRLRLDRGRRGVRRRPGAASTGHRLQARRRSRARLLPHRPAAPARRAAGQVRQPVPRLLQAARGHRRRCSTTTATTTPATSSPRSAPDQLVYLDRRNNVLKLSQGEFVTVSKLEAVFGDSPLVRQIYRLRQQRTVLPARRHRADRRGLAQPRRRLTAVITESLQDVARAAGLQSYEIPRDFIIETTPFTLENGLLTGIRKLARPKLKERYGDRLEAAVRRAGRRPGRRAARAAPARRPTGRCWRPSRRAAGALLGAAAADVQPDAHFTDLGGDSLSALTFAQPAARDLRRRRARRRDRQPGQRPARAGRLHRGRAPTRRQAADVRVGARPRRRPRCTPAT